MTANKSKPRVAAVRRNVKAAPKEDHRVRNGAVRREQTRRKLLAAAMVVFAEKGIDAPLIDDFIAAAGVARGTFYNYFNTSEELLDAVTSELSDKVFASIEEVVRRIADPLSRMVCACLLYMHLGSDVPNWGKFVLRAGSRSSAVGKLVDVYLPRDLELARKAGKVSYTSVRAARDLIFGTLQQGILTVQSGDAPKAHLRELMALSLRGIGVASAAAIELSEMALPEVVLPAYDFEVAD